MTDMLYTMPSALPIFTLIHGAKYSTAYNVLGATMVTIWALDIAFLPTRGATAMTWSLDTARLAMRGTI